MEKTRHKRYSRGRVKKTTTKEIKKKVRTKVLKEDKKVKRRDENKGRKKVST